jgi:hypothetical protein
MLGQFKKDYVALNLPNAGVDANSSRGWPKKSLWRVRNILRKYYLIKGCMFFPRFITILSAPAGRFVSVSAASQVFVIITDHMKSEKIVLGWGGFTVA